MNRIALLLVLAASSSVFANGEPVDGFPNWKERVMHEWTNRARCDPQVEMQACGTACGEGACYTPQPPLPWNEKLNHAARFHSDEMHAQGYFGHDSQCTLVSNIDALYPASCTGAASCACVGGTKTCSSTCTTWSARVGLFGGSAHGEIIASGSDPNGAFYQWLFESYPSSACGYNQGPPTNGHRYNILMSGPAVGYGAGTGASVGDFGSSGTLGKIASGAHYPRSGATVEAWANWYDTAGPMQAMINVDGECSAMALERGSVTNGAYHASVAGVGSGCHRYFFLFKDSDGEVVTYPTTGSLGIGPEGTCADWDASRPATGASCSCTPQCDGKTCGDDGCGGACGNCGDDETCSDAGACVGGGDPGSDGGVGGDGGGGTGNGNGDGAPDDDAGGCCETGGGGGLSACVFAAALLVIRRRRARR